MGSKLTTVREKISANSKFYSFNLSSDKQQLSKMVNDISNLNAIIEGKANKNDVSRMAASQQALYNTLINQVAEKAENVDVLALIGRITSMENQPVLSMTISSDQNIEANSFLAFDTIVVNENNMSKISRNPGYASFSLVPGIYLVSFSVSTIGEQSVWTLNEDSSGEIVSGSTLSVLKDGQSSTAVILKIPPTSARVSFSLKVSARVTATTSNTNITFLGINVPSLLASTISAISSSFAPRPI